MMRMINVRVCFQIQGLHPATKYALYCGTLWLKAFGTQIGGLVREARICLWYYQNAKKTRKKKKNQYE